MYFYACKNIKTRTSFIASKIKKDEKSYTLPANPGFI
jgi:hypothetical protein